MADPSAPVPAEPGHTRTGVTIRRALPEDLLVVHRLIRELALYEGLEDRFVCRVDDLGRELFGTGLIGAVLAEVADIAEVAAIAEDAARPVVVGFALWYYTFSTFRGKRGVYLEDLFVLPEHRGKGYGRALLKWMESMAKESGALRVDWSVLGWNEPAKAFYRSIGAHPVSDWESWRLELNSILER